MHKILYILFLGLFVTSCKDDQNTNSKTTVIENVIGEWKVIESTRNNRKAKSLENAEFMITDSTFSCNFLNNSEAFPYTFDGKQLKVLNPDENVYSVRTLTPDTLILKTEIKNFEFKFISVKMSANE